MARYVRFEVRLLKEDYLLMKRLSEWDRNSLSDEGRKAIADYIRKRKIGSRCADGMP